MRYLRDAGILITYSFLALLFMPADIFFVTAFLLALIIGCIGCFVRTKAVLIIACAVYLMIGCGVPVFLYFVPIIGYALLRQQLYLLAGGVGMVCVTVFLMTGNPLAGLLMLSLGILLAVVLATEADRYEQLEERFRVTRDDSAERNFFLAEKNKAILEKQDYEVYNAILKERNRIAREIHDNVGHMLSRSILLVGAVRAINKEETLKASLDSLDTTLGSAMDSIRSSVHDLHDEAINLEEAIRGLVKDFTFCDIELKYDMPRAIRQEIKYSFIAITKEAMSNIIKHSNATKVCITMWEHPAFYQLIIEDNGTKSTGAGNGIGLSGMIERVQALNGSIQFTQDSGFQIFIVIYKGEGEDEASNN